MTPSRNIAQKYQNLVGLVVLFTIGVSLCMPLTVGAQIDPGNYPIAIPDQQIQVTTPSVDLAATGVNQPEQGVGFGCSPLKLEFKGCVTSMLYGAMVTTREFSKWTGRMLNTSIMKLVVEMNSFVGAPGSPSRNAIERAWSIVRDLANVALVFITIFIGLSIIVGSTTYGSKQMLFKVVLGALFVNFSLLLSTIVIDTSNLLAISIYEEFLRNGGQASVCASAANANNRYCISGGVAGAFEKELSLQTIFGPYMVDDYQPNSETNSRLQWIFGMGTIMFIVLAFVFALTAALIILRFLILLFLMVLSPLGLVIWVTGISGAGRRWWHKLLSQSFFLPFMMLLWLLGLRMMQGMRSSLLPQDEAAMGRIMTDAFAIGDKTVTQDTAHFAIFIYFAFVIGVFLFSLSLAKQMGAAGASAIVANGSTWKRRFGQAAGVAGAGVGIMGGSALANRMNQRRERKYAEANEMDEATGKYKRGGLVNNFRRLNTGSALDRATKTKLDSGAARSVKGAQAQRARNVQIDEVQKQQQFLNNAQLVNQHHGQDDATILASGGQPLLDQVQDARRGVGSMNQKQLEWMRDNHKDVFAHAGVAHQITSAQMKGLEENPQFSSADTGAMKAHRDKAYTAAITGGTPADVRTARSISRNMSDSEVRGQTRAMDQLVATSPAPGTPSYAQMLARFDVMTPKNVASLSPATLLNPEIAHRLTSQHLKALDAADALDQSQRQALRAIFTGPGGHPSANAYVTTGPSAHLWA